MDRWRNKARTAAEILPLLTPGAVICAFDTETTGLPKAGTIVKVIQFSAIRARVTPDLQLEEIDFLDLYINPEESLSSKITQITGITDEMLEDKPSEIVLADDIFRYLSESTGWAAYNADFDLERLRDMAHRVGVFVSENPCIDALEMTRDWFAKGEDVSDYKLGTVYEHLFPDSNVHFHSAIDDVRATIAVMNELIPRYVSALAAPQSFKKKVDVEKARAWINPRSPSQQRIRVKFHGVGEDGDIFYDCVNKCWSCKSTTSARKLFYSINMEDVEEQVLRLCSNWHRTYTSMDQLAHDRMTFLRQKEAAKRQSQKQQRERDEGQDAILGFP